ncbi:metal ABC transporter ATP-binding protein [Amygdalobacter indicium]|uniref:Metal ABC transporter ATP-binding protein n=1 Tax=Amygdalobacter indicium TaxID=3029272 RepID=A0ABY8C866_9FIRM|nr:metal ABC transporter ATP-binding protein [Amygdalobacter indicium]WEG35523.1 metal ABC transporter ATP-binding protein [Amygdalobacter indicium]
MSQIKIKDVSFGYNQDLILKNINFQEEKGEIVAIHGENGSGKSTLLKLLLGQLKPACGEIYLLDENISKFKNFAAVGYVPQVQSFNGITFPITCTEIVVLNLYRQFGFFKIPSAALRKKAEDILCEMGLEHYLHVPYNRLSGGFKQRTLIARAMINEPQLLILDEPTAGVDQNSKINFLELIARTNKEKKTTILIVTHEMGLIKEYLPLSASYKMTEGGLIKC